MGTLNEEILGGRQAIKRQNPKPGETPYYYLKPNTDPFQSITEADVINVNSPDEPNPALLHATSDNPFSRGMSGGQTYAMDVNTTFPQPTKPVTMHPQTDCAMTFDGQNLNLYQGENLVGRIPAMSGAHGYQARQYQTVKNRGPLPEGMYYVDQAGRQYINPVTEALGHVSLGGWSGGRSAWGDSRAWLKPIDRQNTFGRDGFSIHGGDIPGSAGCIDITSHMPEFNTYMDSCQEIVPLNAGYPKQSW